MLQGHSFTMLEYKALDIKIDEVYPWQEQRRLKLFGIIVFSFIIRVCEDDFYSATGAFQRHVNVAKVVSPIFGRCKALDPKCSR